MEQKKKNIRPSANLQYENMSKLLNEIVKRRYERNADFILPQNFRFSDLGNGIAFCQLIATWFSLNPKSKLRVYDNNFSSNENELEHAINQLCHRAELPTLLAITFGIRTGIWGYSNKERNYTKLFLVALEKKLVYDYQELSRVSPSQHLRSEYFQIHPDFLNEALFLKNSSFYLKFGREYIMKNEIAINEATTRLFNRIDSLGTDITANWLKEIQTYFFEIFENAYKWARNNWINKADEPLLDDSVRLFFISTKNYSQQMAQSSFNLDQKLAEFMNKHRVRDAWGSNSKLMELSILDNGLGIVQTFKRLDIAQSNLTIEEEYNLLIDAFTFGTTSDRSYRRAIRGIGLSKVINKIRNALVIIRTGHLHLYRDFDSFPLIPDDDLFFFDISDSDLNTKESARRIQRYPFVRGTLFTFIIPL